MNVYPPFCVPNHIASSSQLLKQFSNELKDKFSCSSSSSLESISSNESRFVDCSFEMKWCLCSWWWCLIGFIIFKFLFDGIYPIQFIFDDVIVLQLFNRTSNSIFIKHTSPSVLHKHKSFPYERITPQVN